VLEAIMIETVAEFVRLRNSEIGGEYYRAAHDEAPLDVWWGVLNNHPDMAFWVAQNKTVPYEILEHLSEHNDSRVRTMVSSKNKLEEPLLLKLALDSDDAIRMNIARHKKATARVLGLFRQDCWEEVSKVADERVQSGKHK
jgi:hypothetical protein